MEHVEIVDRLSEYIDDELSAADKELVERHLATCPECVETLTAMKAVTEMISRMPRMELPENAAGRLAAAIDERIKSGSAPAPKTSQASWRRWATSPTFLSVAGAAAALVIAVAVWKSPAQISERSTQGSPTLSAPQAAGEHGGYGGDELQGAGPEAAARQTVDQQLDQAAAGVLPKKLAGQPSAAEDRSATPTKPAGPTTSLKDSHADSSNISVDKAAALAGGGHPIRLLYSAAGAWKQDAAWIVIVERTDKTGNFIGAVVGQKDGRILYSRTKQRP